MRKLDKKAKKAKKAAKARKAGHVPSWCAAPKPPMTEEDLRELWNDPDALVWSPASLAEDCCIRSAAATAWFMRDVYGAYYRTMHDHSAIHSVTGTVTEEQAKRLTVQIFSDSLFAFSGEGRALPELADAVRDTVLQAFGLRGRPGIAVSVVYGWLAEHLPEDRAAPFRDVDWEALAGQIAEQALAKAKPAFVDAYRRLRDLTARYPAVPQLDLAVTDASSEACGLPSFVPAHDAGRMSFLSREQDRCTQLLASCVKLRQDFADMLHNMVGKAVANYTVPLVDMEELWSGDFALWFLKEAETDVVLMLEEFAARYEAAGRGFDVFIAYWNRVGLMLRSFTAGAAVDFYHRRIKQLYDFIEGRRVVPNGAW